MTNEQHDAAAGFFFAVLDGEVTIEELTEEQKELVAAYAEEIEKTAKRIRQAANA